MSSYYSSYHSIVSYDYFLFYFFFCIFFFCLFFFFFFQAEDGIRDLYVTGVQTCALPISSIRTCTSSLWETQSDATRRIAVGIAARVIEVQVRIDHPTDVGGGMPELRERIFELGTPVLPLVHDSVDVFELLVFLVAEPRVHKHEPVVVLDQEAAQRQGNAVALVGRNAALPQRFRHDAEHGAAVEGLAAGLERVAGEAADSEGGVGHQKSERGTRNAELCGRVARPLTPSPLVRVPTSAFRIRAC